MSKGFVSMLAGYAKENGVKINDALTWMMQKHPAVWREYLEAQSGIRGPGGASHVQGDFMACVEGIQLKTKCSKHDAVFEAIRRHPDKHKVYIHQANKRS
jgi:hypothetical protein